MSTVAISIAESPDDITAVKQLCRDFVTWLLAAHPEQREKILIYFEPVKWQRTLAELPEIHARPDTSRTGSSSPIDEPAHTQNF